MSLTNFPDTAAWLRFLQGKSLPVLRHSVRALQELDRNRDQADARSIARIVLQDPLLALRVLAYLEKRRSGPASGSTVATIGRAVVMLGVDAFFRACAELTEVEQLLAGRPRALLGMLQVVARARRAAHFAREIAVLRHDAAGVDEITAAALLHECAEMLAWIYTPEAAQRIAERQAQDPSLRSGVAQLAEFGYSYHDVQFALAGARYLPPLLGELMDEAALGRPRVKNVFCAINLARHRAHGANDPALADDYAEIAALVHLAPDQVIARLHLAAAA
ncbi:MAG: HDOD domain-containing protein [Rhodocyclaceae bacterium]|nr:HDOD domain-containing protein [Rhodocyclaceae bacterium]MBX3668306.1 HDOD domain-containing protein [Rhodocyclaceae bacterium]